jgi:hypothetical protein
MPTATQRLRAEQAGGPVGLRGGQVRTCYRTLQQLLGAFCRLVAYVDAKRGALPVFITGAFVLCWRLGPLGAVFTQPREERHDVAMGGGAEMSQPEEGTTAAEVPGSGASADDSGKDGVLRAGPTKPPSSIAESLLAQATAALALAIALIYAAGGLSLGLKLWFLRVPWTTVLGQLPHDPLIITAVGQVVVPCLAAGAVLGALIDWLSGMRAGDETPGGQDRPMPFAWSQWYLDKRGLKFLGLTVLLALVVGLLLGGVPLLVLMSTSHVASGELQSVPAIWVCCGLLSFATATGLLYVVRALHTRSAAPPDRRMQPALRRTLLVASVSVALIPCLCSVSGAFLLPPVFLCSPKFFHPVGDDGQEAPGYMAGNLIGSNDQWIYIAQFGQSHGQVDFRTITAVPAGTVQLQAIGQGSGCRDLTG